MENYVFPPFMIPLVFYPRISMLNKVKSSKEEPRILQTLVRHIQIVGAKIICYDSRSIIFIFFSFAFLELHISLKAYNLDGPLVKIN